jgi:hypothetical protein
MVRSCDLTPAPESIFILRLIHYRDSRRGDTADTILSRERGIEKEPPER